MVDETQVKEVGAVRVMKGTSINGSNTNDFHLVDLADSRHAFLILIYWSATIKNGCTKKRRVRSGLVEFKCGEAQNNYYYGTYTVDDNNNNRKGFLSIKDESMHNDSNKRQF